MRAQAVVAGLLRAHSAAACRRVGLGLGPLRGGAAEVVPDLDELTDELLGYMETFDKVAAERTAGLSPAGHTS